MLIGAYFNMELPPHTHTHKLITEPFQLESSKDSIFFNENVIIFPGVNTAQCSSPGVEMEYQEREGSGDLFKLYINDKRYF